MKVIKNPTNEQIALELCKQNPESKFASFLKYDGKTIQADRLDLFTNEPDIANEFITAMANKVVVQRAYDLFRGYKMPFASFMKTMGRLGDAEELISSQLASVGDYDGDAKPFNASKPNIVLSWIKTEDRKVVNVKLSYDIWAGAFTTEQGLSNIVGIILKNLRDAIEVYVYEKIVADLSSSTNFTKTANIELISGAGETDKAQKAYEQIIKLVVDMAIPSTTYNNAGVKTMTPVGRGILVLNSLYKASFDVNVLASLFNSAKIGEDNYFKEVIVAPLSGANQVGLYLDEEAYLWGYRFVVGQSIVNPANLTTETYYHAWVKRGVVPFRQAVRLLGVASE